MLTIEDLEKQLKSGKLASLYLLFGEETYLLESNLKKIKKLFGETTKGINYILLDEDNIENIISDIETPAFGYEKKLIIARNTGLFKKEGKRKNEKIVNLKERLKDYLKDNIETVNEGVVLVFVEEDCDKFSLFKTVDSLGVVCKFEHQKPLQLKKRIAQICKAYKVNIDDNTLQYFVECCGSNMQDLINEIRKLIEFAGENGTIKKEDIDLLSTKQIESVIFDLTDNLGKKNVQSALEVLNNLIYSKEPVQKILITLYNHFKKLYLVKMAEKNNKDIAISLDLKPNQMFLVNKYKAQARCFKEEELRHVIGELIDLDYKYKVGLIDVNVGLEAILCCLN
jgi:DNA polymerase-3 subunit delta